MEGIAKHYLTSFAHKVKLYNLQTNSRLPFDLSALLEILTQRSDVAYHDKHPYTEIKRHINEHVHRVMRKKSLVERMQVEKSLQLTTTHQRNLQAIQVGDYFTCHGLEFIVMEITMCASVRIRLLTCPPTHPLLPHPVLSDPRGFIVRVSQDGTYKLRIKPHCLQLHFQHDFPWKPCIWLLSMMNHPDNLTTRVLDYL